MLVITVRKGTGFKVGDTIIKLEEPKQASKKWVKVIIKTPDHNEIQMIKTVDFED